MITKKVTRYHAECGKGFWNKASCLRHEKNCKCWNNPKNRTCKTCAWANAKTKPVSAEICKSLSMEPHENIVTGDGYECTNPLNESEHSGAPKGITNLSVNCSHYLSHEDLEGQYEDGIL